MPRLVVVSNRLADPRKTAAGGLAVALAEVLNNTGGLWFGWSGKIVEAAAGGRRGEGELRTQQAGPVKLVTVDLSREDVVATLRDPQPDRVVCTRGHRDRGAAG